MTKIPGKSRLNFFGGIAWNCWCEWWGSGNFLWTISVWFITLFIPPHLMSHIILWIILIQILLISSWLTSSRHCPKANSGTGPDDISYIFLAESKYALATLLHILCNKSLSSGIFSDQWKVSMVCLILGLPQN